MILSACITGFDFVMCREGFFGSYTYAAVSILWVLLYVFVLQQVSHVFALSQSKETCMRLSPSAASRRNPAIKMT